MQDKEKDIRNLSSLIDAVREGKLEKEAFFFRRAFTAGDLKEQDARFALRSYMGKNSTLDAVRAARDHVAAQQSKFDKLIAEALSVAGRVILRDV
ncbi:MAG: hypothetical protein M1832_003010 [Thelocarpon impressellum]|nr:MAG: hypothetical protein M1832_003010 [Thelocarpon impressellum]